MEVVTHMAKTAELRELVYERFRSAGVDMPNETIELQSRQWSAGPPQVAA